jgi:glycosyltransferase involved in cell wall biosynthesis
VGAGTYLTELAAALGRRPEVELHLVAKTRDAADLLAAAPDATVHGARLRSRPSRLVWEQTLLPRRVRRLRPDVFHGPHYTVPAGVGCPAVVTFHDPTFFTHPDLHERSKVAYFTRMARLGAKRATRVIAVSEYAARGAIEHAGVEAARVSVVPLGVDPARYAPLGDPAADERLRARVGVRGPYVLYVGAIEPRKDVPTLVEAFARLRDDVDLVLAGLPAWGAAAVGESIDRTGTRDRIQRTGYISEEEKVALYRGASVFVYPSIAEGFGLPVLEALACGAPVVTTTGSAPEEVAHGVATLVPPRDPEALAGAIASVLGDARVREEARRRGPERAAGYTWERTATETMDVYRAAAAS